MCPERGVDATVSVLSMRSIAAAALVPALLLALATGGSAARKATEQGPGGRRSSSVTQVPETINVLMPDGSVRTMYMDDYLKGVLPAEVSPGWPYDALCAQAVAARSYAATSFKHMSVGANVCTTTCCQAWAPAHYPSTDLAVDSTHKVAALYDGNVIQAFYFAHCDGRTRDSEDVWTTALPYCRSVSCPCGNTTLLGHGVGMCQEGARVLAADGWDYKDILKHYYTGVDVRSTEARTLHWYFAEGTTRREFATYICIANPGDTDAGVIIHYLVSGGGSKDAGYAVPAHSRVTVSPAQVIGYGKDFSCEVESANGVPVVAERSMYFNYKGVWTGGHDALGSAYLRPTWYFAEGTTRPGFDTYLSVGNPSGGDAEVTVSYFLDGGGGSEARHLVPAGSRTTIPVEGDIGRGKDFSCRVQSNGVDLVVERPMYFNYMGAWTGGHDVLGALSTKTSWYFAEGSTRQDFRTFFCLANPNAAPVEAKLSFMMQGGESREATFPVPASGRKTILASDVVGGGKDFSCRITCSSEAGIIAERPMYFDYMGAWTGGSDTVGTPFPRPYWYFAEGTTRPCFHTYLCISNPTPKRANVRITYLRGGGATESQDVSVDPQSRLTLRPGDVLGVGDDDSHDFATRVECANNVGIIAERVMYFDYGSGWSGGHTSLGY